MTPPDLAAVPALEDSGPVELDAREKRRQREKRRRDKLEAAAAKRAERAAAKAAALEAREAKAAAPELEQHQAEPELEARTDTQRGEDLAAMLSGVVWPLLSFVAGIFGWELAALEEGEAKRDALAWVPIARRYRWLDLAATWAAAPARLLARVKAKATRKAAAATSSAELPPVSTGEARA